MDADSWVVMTAAATISTALATGVSTLAALWWRKQDRPEVDWAPAPGRALGRSGVGTFIVNAGDGTAFRVFVRGEHCEAQLNSYMGEQSDWSPLTFIAAAYPGDRIGLEVRCDPEEWDRATVLVEWTLSPTRKKKRRTLTIPLREIADRPVW